jgi:hypothetical protein
LGPLKNPQNTLLHFLGSTWGGGCVVIVTQLKMLSTNCRNTNVQQSWLEEKIRLQYLKVCILWDYEITTVVFKNKVSTLNKQNICKKKVFIQQRTNTQKNTWLSTINELLNILTSPNNCCHGFWLFFLN